MRLGPAAVAAAREGQAAQLGIDDFGLSYSTKGPRVCVHVYVETCACMYTWGRGWCGLEDDAMVPRSID